MAKWRHVHSMDTRKVAAANALRAALGLEAGKGHVTLMKYNPETGEVRAKVTRPATAEEKRAHEADYTSRYGYLPRRGLRTSGASEMVSVTLEAMKGTQGEPVWRPRADGGTYLTRADDDGVCRCRGYESGEVCHLHGLKP